MNLSELTRARRGAESRGRRKYEIGLLGLHTREVAGSKPAAPIRFRNPCIRRGFVVLERGGGPYVVRRSSKTLPWGDDERPAR
jgi:hypothetical protein